jgi:hypothetical protein
MALSLLFCGPTITVLCFLYLEAKVVPLPFVRRPVDRLDLTLNSLSNGRIFDRENVMFDLRTHEDLENVHVTILII